MKVLIPVWYKVSANQVTNLSPLLADRLALNTEKGLSWVASQIEQLIRRETQSYRPGMPAYAGPLTKKVLTGLPEGAFLLSNVFNPDLTPKVAQVVPEKNDREKFWIYLKEHNISRTKFYVFDDAEEYRSHMSARSIWSK